MKNLLVCIDFSDQTEKLLDQAKLLAGAISAKVWLLHVANPTPDFISFEIGPQVVRDQQAHCLREEHRRLQHMQEEFSDTDIETVALMVQGATIDKILDEAERLCADIIIMGTHGSGNLHHLLVGSVSNGVIQKATCPIMLVPTKRL